MTQNDLQNELKISLGSPLGSKVVKVGPRTPSSQTVYGHLEPKWLQKGVRLETKIGPKIVLIAEIEKVGDLEGPRVAKWTLQTSKINENHWRGCKFKLFTLFSQKSLFDRFPSSRGVILGAFWELF